MITWQVIWPAGTTWGLYDAVTPTGALEKASCGPQFKNWMELSGYLQLEIDRVIDNKILLRRKV